MGIYKDKAYLYDTFMKVIRKNYNEEINTILPYLTLNKTILELGGGTGNFSKILSDKGFDIICSDNSSEMINLAKKKGLPCKKIDMRNFSLEKNVDIILSMFNTLMHNQNEKELEENIESCKKNLNPGGILIIEINNPEKLMKMEKYSYSIELEPTLYLTQIDIRKGNTLFHHFVFSDISSKESIIDTHKTIIFSSKKIKTLLEKYFSSMEVIDKDFYRYFIGKIKK